ncbi:MAG: IS21 family transposase [Candidatus Aegiribacteria sp.]|nr:IS21 family transposase [Candidatus Aegiribacteria sp.]
MDNISERVRMARHLNEQGLSKTNIASDLGVHRTTVHRWLNDAECGKRKRKSKLDPYRDYIRSRLRDYNLPGSVVLREIQELGYTGRITILRDFMLTVKSGYIQKVVDRFETDPGRQGQIDWGDCGYIMVGGIPRKLNLFLIVLGYSRYMWGEFTTTTRRPELMRLLEKGFLDIGGVPREVIVDNMKQAIDIARSQSSPAVVNSDFLEFGSWYGFKTVACPPYWPQAKGKVERGIGYVKHSFLEGRSFTDLDDLNRQLRIWLAETANVRVHGTTKERPVDRLVIDRAAMGKVQADCYPSVERYDRLADHDGMISFRGVRYSVDPSILLKRKRGVPVTVTVSTDNVLRIHHEEQLVGRHIIASSGSQDQIDPLHAARRRELSRKPRYKATASRQPKFNQVPAVDERSLDIYEEVACADSVVV